MTLQSGKTVEFNSAEKSKLWSVYLCCDAIIKPVNSIFELWEKFMRTTLKLRLLNY